MFGMSTLFTNRISPPETADATKTKDETHVFETT
jgi:hypothetical protein